MITRLSGAALLTAAAVTACEGSTPSSSPGRPDAASGSPAASATTAPPATSAEPALAFAVLAPEYRGTVGQGGAAVMRLYHDQSRVLGSYFLESAGTAVALAGTASGMHLALDESVDKVKTGSLAIDVAPDGKLTGTWTDAQGAKPSPLHLDPIVQAPHPTTALLFKRTLNATTPVRDAKSKDEVCKAHLTYAEVFGLAPTVEAKLNLDLAPTPDLVLPDKCVHPTEVTGEYRVAHNADGILSVRSTTTVTDPQAATPTHSGRVVNVLIPAGTPVKLFGDVVKPKAERTFEGALNQGVVALTRKHNLDANGRKALDQALAFSPPFVLEERGVRLFADTLPAPYTTAGAEGVLVPYANLPKPHGATAVLWEK
jgi:hypothetical protein